jgi:hypothetical protein
MFPSTDPATPCPLLTVDLSYVGDKAQEIGATGQKEANKDVAKDSDASLGTRASAAKDAVGNKVDETSNSVCFLTFSGIACN